MSEPMPFAADPDSLTPADRIRAVAALLAAGLLRIGRPLPSPTPADPPPGEKVSENSPNGLATGPEQSVTVSAG